MQPLLAALIGVLVGGALALWPGNTLSVTIREASRRGGRSAIGAAAGRTAADLLALCALGLTVGREPALFAGRGAFPIAFGVVTGVCLAGFGWRLMEYHSGGALHREPAEPGARAWHENLFLDRLLGSLGSPLWHLFWWTAGLRLVAEAARAGGTVGVAAFGACFLAPGLAWHGFVALRLVRPGRERALKDRQYRILTSLGGLALVGVGFWVGIAALGASPLRAAIEKAVATIFA